MKKKILIIAIAMICACACFAQTSDSAPQMAKSGISNKDARFLLFPTKNIHIFLKLDTSTGEVWILQYSTSDKTDRLGVKLTDEGYPLVTDAQKTPGRFFLYPTENFYNYLLIDQIDGRVWQVQWSTDREKRLIVPIEFF